jgi:hypothetical protein
VKTPYSRNTEGLSQLNDRDNSVRILGDFGSSWKSPTHGTSHAVDNVLGA